MRSKPLRVVLLIVAATFCCAALGYGLAWYRVQRARQFVEQLRELRVGQTEQQAEEFSRRFGGKYSPPQPATESSPDQPAHYFSSITSPFLTIGEKPYPLPGLRIWVVLASLSIENGRLSEVYASQYVLRSDNFGLGTSIELSKSRHLGDLLDFGPYYVFEAHITGPAGERFGVRLAPEATPDEHRKAFDFNFSCLTRLRECRHVCEMLPSAWRDLPLTVACDMKMGANLFPMRSAASE